MKRFTLFLMALLVSTTVMWAQVEIKGISGDGTKEKPYLIGSSDDWDKVRDDNFAGNTFKGKFLKLTGDFMTHRSFDKTFSGNLDGDSHTIKVDIINHLDCAALFCSVDNATFRNLKVDGVMNTGQHGAALIGSCDGNLTLENINVSATVTSNYLTLNTGGIIGHAKKATLHLRGVVFTGYISTHYAGGIIGWGDNYTATLTDVFFCGSHEHNVLVPIARKADGVHTQITGTNLYTTVMERSTVADEIAAKGTFLIEDEKPDKLGKLTKDYGLVKFYEHGASVNNKYYSIPELQGQGTQEDPFLISDTDDWKKFSTANKSSNTFAQSYLKLTADLTTDLAFPKSFRGTFDGDGHTITANIKNNDDHTALFMHVSGATIRNLKLAGSMEVGNYGAALAGACDGDLTLENIVVSTDVTISKGDYCGGIIGHCHSSKLTLSGVVYSGKISVQPTNKVTIGGIVGWGYSNTLNMKDVFFCGTVNHHSSDYFSPIATKHQKGKVTVTASNVITMEHDFNMTPEIDAYSGMIGFLTDNEESCGTKTRDYGPMQAYQRGILFDGKLYRSSALIHAGTQEDPYLMYSKEDWEYNRSRGEAEGYPGKYFLLKADITINSAWYDFKGTFDGGGHTITSEIKDSHSDYTALFMHVNGVTIRNLKLAGDMKVSRHGAALVGGCDGDLTLENIVVSANLSYQCDGDAYGGGVIGHAKIATLKLSGVVFNGKMTGESGKGEMLMGGIIGWGDNYTVDMKDILFCGTYEGDTPFVPIAGKYKGATVKKSMFNALYTQESKKAGDANIAEKGFKASISDKADEMGSLVKDYGLLQSYEDGFKVGDTYYRTTGLSGHGTQEHPYLIRNADNWKLAAELNKNGNTYDIYYLKVTSDFTTDLSFDKTFSGHFDGGGHTITSNIKDPNSDYTALFRHVSGATIRNLRMAGEMKVSRHGAALVGQCDGDLTLENIVVSATLGYQFDGDAYGGGVIGHAMNEALKLSGVVFNGKMTGEGGKGEMLMGGIIGWGDNYTATLTDVLFCGTYEGDTPFVPIAGKYKGATVKTSAGNTLYTQESKNAGDAFIAVKGYKADISGQADGCGELVKDYGLLQSYERGLKVGNTYYRSTSSEPSGHGTQEHPYLIRNADDWKLAAEHSRNGHTYYKQYLKVTGDFTTDQSFDKLFSGHIDFGGHTVTSNIKDPNSDYTALFRHVSEATIRNLKMAGETEVAKHGAALVGQCDGDLTLENVVVSTNVTIGNGDYSGGIIGHATSAKLDLSGVVYSGKIVVQSENEMTVGCIVGWGDNYTLNMKDVLSCGSVEPHSSDHIYAIAAKWEKGNGKVTASNVIHTGQNFNMATDNTAYSGEDGFLTDNEESCGTQTKDYGLLQAYQRGFLLDGKFYRSAVLIHAGTQEDPYLFYSNEDWEYNCGRGEAEGYPGKYFLLKGDITVQRSWFELKGTFDGDGHTITSNVMDSHNDYTALFMHVNGVTIRNLKLTGDMKVSRHGAALVGGCDGDLTLENIVVSTNLSYQFDGDAYGGGVIGHAKSATLKLSGVVFNGKMTGESGKGEMLMGGIIGWGDSYTVDMTDVLFCGTYEGDTPFTPIAGKYKGATVKRNLFNALYTQESKNASDAFIAEKGFKATIVNNADDLGPLTKDYGLLQAYERGFKLGDKYYLSTGVWGLGTAENPYLIKNADHWKWIAEHANVGNYVGKHLKVNADFTTDVMFDGAFQGYFDGDNHTITFNIVNKGHFVALFRHTNGATICNLRLAGKMEVGKHGACLVGQVDDTSSLTLRNIVVSSDIKFLAEMIKHTFENDEELLYGGGVIGHAREGNLFFDCVMFNGKMSTVKIMDYEEQKMVGGIIGWGDNYKATLDNVFFCPDSLNLPFRSDGEPLLFTPIAAKHENATVKITATNVWTTESDHYNERTGNPLAKRAYGDAKTPILRKRAEHMGKLTKDYGLVELYDNGFSSKGMERYYTYSLKYLLGEGTEDNPYVILDLLDWQYFTNMCNGGNTFAGKYVKLCTDDLAPINLWPWPPHITNTFSGTFDGDGRKISGYDSPLLGHAKGATIRNLRVSKSEDLMDSGLLVGNCDGDLTLENIVIDAGAVIIGGKCGCVVGNAQNATLNLRGVVYKGTIQSEIFAELIFDPDYSVGGIIGWGNNYTVNMTDVLFCGNYTAKKAFTPIAAKEAGATVKATTSNVLYTQKSKNCNEQNIAVKGYRANLVKDITLLGKLIYDYGLVQSYERGIRCDGKNYHNAEDKETGVKEESIIENENSSDAQWYTLDGRKLDGKPTKPGIYIVNGKKVVVK